MKRIAVIHPAVECGYGAEIPSLPGCISAGDTRDETINIIRGTALGRIDVAMSRTRSKTIRNL
jgi:predicted RNase H-like HicB family nuclease